MAESKIWLRRALQSLIGVVVSIALFLIEMSSVSFFQMDLSHLSWDWLIMLTEFVFLASLVSAIVCFLIHLMPPKPE